MSSTISMSRWLDLNLDTDEYGQVESLYLAVRDRRAVDDFWTVTRKGEQLLVCCCDGQCLCLASENAVDAFLSLLEQRVAPGMGIEAWAACQRAIDNDQS